MVSELRLSVLHLFVFIPIEHIALSGGLWGTLEGGGGERCKMSK